jgi:hypothetical protein
MIWLCAGPSIDETRIFGLSDWLAPLTARTHRNGRETNDDGRGSSVVRLEFNLRLLSGAESDYFTLALLSGNAEISIRPSSSSIADKEKSTDPPPNPVLLIVWISKK